QAKQRILDNVAQLQKMGYGGRLLDEIKGAPELAASILTGLGSNIASGFGGAYTLAKEGINNQVSNGLHFPTKNEIDAGFDSAANSAHNIQSNYTYQPTSLNAKNAQEEIGGVIGGVHQGLASTGGDVGNVADSIVGNKPQVGSGPIGTFMQSAAPAAFDMATTVSPLASAEGAATRAANIGRSTERVEPILGTPTARQPMAVPDVGDLPPVAARNTTSNVWRPGQSPDIPASGASNAQLSALDQLAKDVGKSRYGTVPPVDSPRLPQVASTESLSPLEQLIAKGPQSDVNTIRLGNTESPQNAVTNRYDASGNRIVPQEPFSLPYSAGPREAAAPQDALSSFLQSGKSDLESHAPNPTEHQAPIPSKSTLPAAVESSDIQGALNPKPEPLASGRLAEASSLPVPIKLTKGQATGDVNQISFEQNNRARIPELANRFNEQHSGILENLDALRDQVSPNISVQPGLATDQALVDTIKKVDEPIKADIRAKYQALKGANGGEFPLKGQDFVSAADRALKAENLTRFVPPEVRGLLDDLRETGHMNYNDFENYRTILGQQARKYARAGDGSAETAVNITRSALESLPMSKETAAIKPLADAARAAAKKRFDMLASDPAYKAAVNDETPIGEHSPVADGFINKYVIGGKDANVRKLQEHLAPEPTAKQIIASGVVDHLKQRARIDLRNNAGNISQAALNKAITALDEKRAVVLPPDAAKIAEKIGNVARYTQEQPKWSYVNNSNTLVACLAHTAEHAANFY